MTQKDTIRKHLESGRSITQPEAGIIYGIWRLAAIVHRLRKTMDIKGVLVNGRYSRYYL